MQVKVGGVGGHTVVKELTLSLSTDAYASADVMADTQEVTGAVRENGGSGMIMSIVALDKDDQAKAFDVVFLQKNVSIGTENSAVSVSDTNAEEIIGIVSIIEGDYVDLANSQVATVRNIGLPIDLEDGTSLFVATVARGAPTHTSSGVMLKIGILQD